MQTESFDVDLVLNERQISAAGKSIKGIKKRLHEAELYLNVEPDIESEPGEWESWRKRVDKLIASKETLQFPKRDDISREVEARSALERRSLDHTLPKKTSTHDSWENRLKYLREKQQKGPCKFFGLAAEGEELKTIRRYAGINSSYGEARTLVRKDPRPGLLSEKSSLPDWFGPGYYSHIDPEEGFKSSHSLTAVPFKAHGRAPELTADDLRLSKRERAKRVATIALPRSHSHLNTLCSYERVKVDGPPTELRETNPYSKFGTSSTMLIRNPLSHGDSPKRIYLGKLSSSGFSDIAAHRHGPTLSGADSKCIDENVLYESGEEEENEEEISFFNKASRLKEDRGTEFAASGIDSLLNKYEKTGSTGYRYKDFTLGALTLQVAVGRRKNEEYEKDHVNDDFPNVRTSKRGRVLPIVGDSSSVQEPSASAVAATSAASTASSLNTARSFASKIYGETKSTRGLAHYHKQQEQQQQQSITDRASTLASAGDFDVNDVKINEKRKGGSGKGKSVTKSGVGEEHSLSSSSSVPRFMTEKRSRAAVLGEIISLSSISRGKKKAAALADPANHMNTTKKEQLPQHRYTTSTVTLPTNSMSTLTLDTSSLITDESAAAEDVTRGIISSPLRRDIRPQLREWYAVRDIYSPPRPQTTTYLKEHKSLAAVNFEGLLIGDRNGKTRDESRAEAALLSDHSGFATSLNEETANRLFDEEQLRQLRQELPIISVDNTRTESFVDRIEVLF